MDSIRHLAVWAFAILLSASFPPLSKAEENDRQPQLDLPRAKLQIRGKTIDAQIATEPEQQAKGLMFRESLEPDEGMLFVFDQPKTASFWMKNTLIPLSVAYINAEGMIVEIHEMKALSEKVYTSSYPAVAYALEMRSGWFRDNGIYAGEYIRGLPPRP